MSLHNANDCGWEHTVAATWDFSDALNDFFGGDLFGGPDTEVEIDISLDEAYTGGWCRVVLDTPAGSRGYDVVIPAGVTDGQRLRLAGRDTAGLHGGRRGDLYLVVRVAPDRRYRVSGRDLTVDLPVAAWEAAMGAVASVDTPAGPVRVEIPPGSSSGERIRLPGHGLPNPQGAPGDLYAEVRVVVPQHLTAAERELFARLSEQSTFNPRALPNTD